MKNAYTEIKKFYDEASEDEFGWVADAISYYQYGESEEERTYGYYYLKRLIKECDCTVDEFCEIIENLLFA